MTQPVLRNNAKIITVNPLQIKQKTVSYKTLTYSMLLCYGQAAEKAPDQTLAFFPRLCYYHINLIFYFLTCRLRKEHVQFIPE
jgi:flagellar biosynthesis protein FliQ